MLYHCPPYTPKWAAIAWSGVVPALAAVVTGGAKSCAARTAAAKALVLLCQNGEPEMPGLGTQLLELTPPAVLRDMLSEGRKTRKARAGKTPDGGETREGETLDGAQLEALELLGFLAAQGRGVRDALRAAGVVEGVLDFLEGCEGVCSSDDLEFQIGGPLLCRLGWERGAAAGRSMAASRQSGTLDWGIIPKLHLEGRGRRILAGWAKYLRDSESFADQEAIVQEGLSGWFPAGIL